jgi:hypothetical protein
MALASLYLALLLLTKHAEVSSTTLTIEHVSAVLKQDGMTNPTRWERLRHLMTRPGPDFYSISDNQEPSYQTIKYGNAQTFARSLDGEPNDELGQFDDDNWREIVSYESSANPIRIKFITSPLEERRGESEVIDGHIDLILNHVSFIVLGALYRHPLCTRGQSFS